MPMDAHEDGRRPPTRFASWNRLRRSGLSGFYPVYIQGKSMSKGMQRAGSLSSVGGGPVESGAGRNRFCAIDNLSLPVNLHESDAHNEE
jgi:hypothetical protein